MQVKGRKKSVSRSGQAKDNLELNHGDGYVRGRGVGVLPPQRNASEIDLLLANSHLLNLSQLVLTPELS